MFVILDHATKFLFQKQSQSQVRESETNLSQFRLDLLFALFAELQELLPPV